MWCGGGLDKSTVFILVGTGKGLILWYSVVSGSRYEESGFIYLLLYVAFNSQGHIATGSLQLEETSAYCTVNHRASASNYQLYNMKRPVRDLNRQPQSLEARTLTTTPPSPHEESGPTDSIPLYCLGLTPGPLSTPCFSSSSVVT